MTREEEATPRKPRILVCNDDGYQADGIAALAEAVAPLGEVWVVAPETQQSATSHAISLERPLRLRDLGNRHYAVDGTPTDCAHLAINHLLKERRPDLTVTGINHGPNLANDVAYSGTVAGAMESAILGVPAIAFSLATHGSFDFGPTARFARSLVRRALEDLPEQPFVLNVNVPAGVDPDVYTITRLGKHSYGNEVVESTDPRGRSYYWIGGNDYTFEKIPGTDCHVVYGEQRVSVTPLLLDLTEEPLLEHLARWKIAEFERA